MSASDIVPPNSFILRITREEWLKQVFTIKKYFPGIRRRWEPDGMILLVRMSENGDSFVGYGILERFIHRNELSEGERQECEAMGWKGVLVFKELFRFEPPLLIRETFLAGSNVKGRCLHGYPLTRKQAESILKKAEEYSVLKEVA